VGHDAFEVIRETIREMNKVAIGRVVLTNREHLIALEAFDKGLMGTLLRYPYEVRSEAEYFDDIHVKVTKGHARPGQAHRQPESGEIRVGQVRRPVRNYPHRSHYQKRAGKPITAKERPHGENVVDLMDALRKSIGGEAARPEPSKKPTKKLNKATPGQKEMLMPIAGKKAAKEASAKKPAAKPQRKSA
jgi:DNA end-binding protein Ku